MTTRSLGPEHRHFARTKVNGSAVIHAPESVLRCAIDNISLGGALLRPIDRHLTRLPAGARVTIDLELAGRGASWIRQHGHVQRHAGDQSFAIAFDQLTPDVEDLIEAEVLAGVEEARSPVVVVVDRSRPRRRHLILSLHKQGFRPVGAATPLEAIEFIELSRVPIAAVAIARSLTDAPALQDFLHETQPGVCVEMITDGRCTASIDDRGVVTLQDAT